MILGNSGAANPTKPKFLLKSLLFMASCKEDTKRIETLSCSLDGPSPETEHDANGLLQIMSEVSSVVFSETFRKDKAAGEDNHHSLVLFL